MPRPRRPFSGVEEIVASNTKWMDDEATDQLGVRQRARWEASESWAYRVPNSQYDPLTFLRVLDAVVNIDPDIELRAHKLAPWLAGRSKTMSFDPVTVGKVLADLCEAFEDVLGAKNGLLERSRDWKGAFYRIHRNHETAALYRKAREDLMRLVGLEMDARASGKRPDRLASPLLECGSLRGEWVDGDA